MTTLLRRTLTILVAAAALSLTPLLAWAVDPSVDVSLYKSNNTVTVELQNPTAIDDDVNALQLTLSMDATEGSMDGITPGFVFNSAYNASVKQARYNDSVHDLTIYVAGAQQNLLPQDTRLVLGWVVFNTVSSASATFDVNVAEDSLAMVGSLRNPLPGEAIQTEGSQATVVVNGTSVSVNGEDQPSPKPGDNGGYVGGNPQNPLPPSGYNAETDTPEQYFEPTGEIPEATPNADNLDPSANPAGDESVTSDSNVSPSVAQAQRDASAKAAASKSAQQAGGLPLPLPAIIGIIVAVVVVAGLLFYLLYWRNRQNAVPNSTQRR